MFRRIFSGSEYEKKIGYCRAVVAGNFVYVAGTVGAGETVEEQCSDALNTIRTALQSSGADFANVVRATYLLADAGEFERCWPLLQSAFGKNPPAATMMEVGLIDPKYRIEIEVTAMLAE